MCSARWSSQRRDCLLGYSCTFRKGASPALIGCHSWSECAHRCVETATARPAYGTWNLRIACYLTHLGWPHPFYPFGQSMSRHIQRYPQHRLLGYACQTKLINDVNAQGITDCIGGSAAENRIHSFWSKQEQCDKGEESKGVGARKPRLTLLTAKSYLTQKVQHQAIQVIRTHCYHLPTPACVRSRS